MKLLNFVSSLHTFSPYLNYSLFWEMNVHTHLKDFGLNWQIL
jgi:hypothetical protein